MSAPKEPDAARREAFRRIASDVAERAAELVMGGYRTGVSERRKAGAELFTEYDVRCEKFICSELARLTPEVAIVGEESGGQAQAGLTWFIDPIDGTINYIAGHPYFAVSIGLMYGTRPQAGAVVAPAMGISWSGAVGGRAFRNGEACRVSLTADLSDAIVGTGFPSRRRWPNQDPRSEEFERVLNSARDVRRCGASAIDLCLVADGTTEAYWMRHLAYWDTGAGAAIVLAAGGSWETLTGDQAEVGRSSQDLATNGLIRDELVRELFK